MDEKEKTLPRSLFPEGYKKDSSALAAGRYGTLEMVNIWGPQQTFEYSLRSLARSSVILSRLHPDFLPPHIADEISTKASLQYINPDRIRQLEEEKGHDIIAITRALEEVVSQEAKPHVGELRTSADTSQNARAMQLRDSLEVIASSTENLRDILIEKALEWKDTPFMDCTHGYDAQPSVAGRAFIHYAETLQSGLNLLRFVYENAIVGKWADATGNHHSANSVGIDGLVLQEEFCKDINVGFMDAPAQIPALEFEADVTYALARISETVGNVAKYIKWGRSDDVNVFVNASPTKKKGSSALPHKDTKNGNPTSEEQARSMKRYMHGNMVTALENCEMEYARDLDASANERINFEDGFKFADHAIRNVANIAYWIVLRTDRSEERVLRSYGAVTSQRVMNNLTDVRRVKNPMPRSQAHDLMGKLATQAWDNKIPLVHIVLDSPEVSTRLNAETIMEITDPLTYIGESKKIIELVAKKHHKKKTL